MKKSTEKSSKSKQLLRLPKQLKLSEELSYQWLKVLGKGGYAVVISAKRVSQDGGTPSQDDNKPDQVAIKTIIKESFEPGKVDQVVQYTKREIDIMRRLDHPNVVRMYNHWQDDSCIYLILEFCPNKTLSSIIRNDSYSLTVAQIKQFLHEMASGCKYLHEKLIVHRDLKPENILLDHQFNAKIADFGLSIVLKSRNELLHTFCGTLKYQAPEMVERKGYSFGVDVWALGCIAYRLYYGNAPFDGQSSEQIYQAILNKCAKYVRLSKDNCPIETHDIAVMKSMLHKNATLRITVDLLLQDTKYFGAGAESNKASSIQKCSLASLPTSIPSPPSGGKLDKMVTCMKAISNYEANKRVRISYSAHHSCQLMPKYWITEWVDINLFGFGYLFNKNIYGFNFKKGQRMMLLNGQSVVFLDQNKLQSFQLSACPDELAKDFRVLKQSHGLLIEQIERENMSYPEMDINLCKSNLPWLLKKMFIASTKLIAMAFHFQNDLIQLTFVENQKILLFDAQHNSITIIKNDQFLCLSLEFLLDGHINEAIQSHVSESLKYIQLLLDQ